MKRLMFSMALFVMSTGCQSSFQSMPIGGGRSLIVLRNAEDAYPIYASTFEVAFQGALDTKADVTKATFKTGASSEIKKLYEDLDNANADLRVALVTGYSGYVLGMSAATTATERRSVSEAFDKLLLTATELAAEVRKLTQQLAAAQNQTTADWETPISLAERVRAGAAEARDAAEANQ